MKAKLSNHARAIMDLNTYTPSVMHSTFKMAQRKPVSNNSLGALPAWKKLPEDESTICANTDNVNIEKIGIAGPHWLPKIIKIISRAEKNNNGVITKPTKANNLKIVITYVLNNGLLSWNLDNTGWIVGAITLEMLEIGNCINLYDFS